jgi:LmbE family N-acetylglucosaminyl deacetylase
MDGRMENQVSEHRLIAIFAHPCDASFRAGGTLALLTHGGVRVYLLTATRGEAGSCGEAPLGRSDEQPTVCMRELQCACATLGLESPCVLDYRDGHLDEADLGQLCAQILQMVNAVSPQVILSFGLDGIFGHPDHIAIGKCTAEVFRYAEQVAALYTVAVPWSLAARLEMRHVRAVPDADIALCVDVSSVWKTKLAAIRCHATQLSTSPMMYAPVALQKLFFGTEYFVRFAVRQTEEDFFNAILEGQG